MQSQLFKLFYDKVYIAYDDCYNFVHFFYIENLKAFLDNMISIGISNQI